MKKFVSVALACGLILSFAGCSSNTNESTTNEQTSDTRVDTGTVLSEETSATVYASDADISENTTVTANGIYSLEGMSASEIMAEVAQYWTTCVPTEGQNVDEFIGSLPVAPESYGNSVGGYAGYADYFSDGVFPDRVDQINWLNYNMEGDTCTNIGTTDNDGNQVDISNVIFTIHDKSLALELVDLYREAIQSDSETHGAVCQDNSHDDIWEILWSRAGKVQFKFTMEVNTNDADGGYVIHVWHYQE